MAGLIGVFGGTFDPPHLGHLVLADEAYHALALEKVLWVVTGDPPHKPGMPITPVEHRLAMVQAAIAGDDRFELSRADVDRPGPHYAEGTLRWLQERLPGIPLAYLMGADSLRDLPDWHQPERFLARCDRLGVMRRPGIDVDLQALEARLPGVAAKVRFFDAPLIGVSARGLRRRISHGLPHRYLLPTEVLEYIETKGLYR